MGDLLTEHLGIDIGTASIKIIELEKQGGRYSLHNYGLFSLKSASAKISHLEAWVEKLEEESSQKSKKIEKLSKQLTDSETQNENLKNSFYLDNKPLPALPVEENKLSTKQNIFKQLKTKAKVKFQKLQKLIKREKFHNQEVIAQIEVKSK